MKENEKKQIPAFLNFYFRAQFHRKMQIYKIQQQIRLHLFKTMFVNLSSPIPINFLLEIGRLEKQKKQQEIGIIKIKCLKICDVEVFVSFVQRIDS